MNPPPLFVEGFQLDVDLGSYPDGHFPRLAADLAILDITLNGAALLIDGDRIRLPAIGAAHIPVHRIIVRGKGAEGEGGVRRLGTSKLR